MPNATDQVNWYLTRLIKEIDDGGTCKKETD